MGIKGDKRSSESALTAELMVERLAAIPGITSKGMFGGQGIFHEGKMFGLVDSKGQGFLKVDDSNRDQFESAGAKPHGKMPYLSIPESVFNDPDQLTQWAQTSIDLSK
ncbi:MAG: TfoX/Sxy family protein [Reichenbachiella sp.]|uniref:TfoX/Sxy family protein n=1 Tax=Reichenbachiella sp. TaxID=2184521 RepID=UPI003298C27E